MVCLWAASRTSIRRLRPNIRIRGTSRRPKVVLRQQRKLSRSPSPFLTIRSRFPLLFRNALPTRHPQQAWQPPFPTPLPIHLRPRRVQKARNHQPSLAVNRRSLPPPKSSANPKLRRANLKLRKTIRTKLQRKPHSSHCSNWTELFSRSASIHKTLV